MEVFLSSHRFKDLHATLEKTATGDKDRFEPISARQLQGSRQENHPRHVDQELTEVEAALAAQDHQFANQHILFSVDLNGLICKPFKLLKDLFFFLVLQVHCVDTNDELEDCLPETEGVLNLLPFVP